MNAYFSPQILPEVQLVATFAQGSKKAALLTLNICGFVFDGFYHIVTSRLFRAVLELAWMFLVWLALVAKEKVSGFVPVESVIEIAAVEISESGFDPDPIGTELQTMDLVVDPILAPTGDKTLTISTWTKAQCKSFLDSAEIPYGKKDRLDVLRAKVMEVY